MQWRRAPAASCLSLTVVDVAATCRTAQMTIWSSLEEGTKGAVSLLEGLEKEIPPKGGVGVPLFIFDLQPSHLATFLAHDR